jgi:hypothetical protein
MDPLQLRSGPKRLFGHPCRKNDVRVADLLEQTVRSVELDKLDVRKLPRGITQAENIRLNNVATIFMGAGLEHNEEWLLS